MVGANTYVYDVLLGSGPGKTNPDCSDIAAALRDTINGQPARGFVANAQGTNVIIGRSDGSNFATSFVVKLAAGGIQVDRRPRRPRDHGHPLVF